jgi:hypothetical protein
MEEKLMKNSALLAGASLGALMLGSVAVSAAPVTLEVCNGSSCWNGNYQIANGVVVDWTNVEARPNGSGNSVNNWEGANGLDLSDWSLSMDSDPFVTNNFTITNTTASTQTYSLTTTLAIAPVIPNGLMRGSIGFTLTNNTGGSATLSTSGASIYQGIIDGNVARTLWDSPTTFTTASSTGAGIDFGFPTREGAPESIDSTIGVTIMLSLTAGDSASFTSGFDVIPVPLPAAVWLFGSALLGLFGVARHRVF